MPRRNEENCLPGFNLVVIDVDGTVSMNVAQMLLGEYQYYMYTTKRHTDKVNRFRIIFPLSHKLDLSAKDFKEFMGNIFEWLPFEIDRQTGQRARKWLSNDGDQIYHDGERLNALNFIPKTKKTEDRKAIISTQQGFSNVERWFLNSTEEGNRSNQLIRYGYMLVDTGLNLADVQDKINIMNNKLPDGLSDSELSSTIFYSLAKAIAKRDNV